MANSAAVTANVDTATADQYNNLRLDVLDPATGHGHDGVTGSAIRDAADLVFGTSLNAVVRWSTGDASNPSLVIGLGDSNQALHITDKAAIATDWNLSADTHPSLYIHSNTTPATDYLRIGNHDGTEAEIDVVGGTTLDLQIAGTSATKITATTLVAAAANAGGVVGVGANNTDNTNSASHARLGLEVGGSSGGDAFTALILSTVQWAVGMDNSASDRYAIAANSVLGTNDALRITNATPPVATYNTTHPTGTFDYACDACGCHGGEKFECCGAVKWHDDRHDFIGLMRREPSAMDYMERVGVIERTFNNEGEPEVFTRLDLMPMFIGSMAVQIYEELNRRLEAIGA